MSERLSIENSEFRVQSSEFRIASKLQREG